MKTKEEHDKDCELYGGFQTCKCWLRARGFHPALGGVRRWYLEQHPEDQHSMDAIIDRIDEMMHTIDREQERREERRKPTTPTPHEHGE